jgi:hypothetical protein
VAVAERVIFPTIRFEDVTLAEAAEFLNFRLKELSKEAESCLIVVDPKVDGTQKITNLQLDNVPLSEVLKHCAQATQTTLQATDAEIRFTQP